MIKVLKRSKIDINIWNGFIEQTPQRSIYALSWYLDTIPRKWEALVEYNAQGNLVAVLPYQLTKKFQLRKVEQDAFTNELGVYYKESHSPTKLIHAFYKRHRFISRYLFNTSNTYGLFQTLPHETTYHQPIILT